MVKTRNHIFDFDSMCVAEPCVYSVCDAFALFSSHEKSAPWVTLVRCVIWTKSQPLTVHHNFVRGLFTNQNIRCPSESRSNFHRWNKIKFERNCFGPNELDSTLKFRLAQENLKKMRAHTNTTIYTMYGCILTCWTFSVERKCQRRIFIFYFFIVAVTVSVPLVSAEGPRCRQKMNKAYTGIFGTVDVQTTAQRVCTCMCGLCYSVFTISTSFYSRSLSICLVFNQIHDAKLKKRRKNKLKFVNHHKLQIQL